MFFCITIQVSRNERQRKEEAKNRWNKELTCEPAVSEDLVRFECTSVLKVAAQLKLLCVHVNRCPCDLWRHFDHFTLISFAALAFVLTSSFSCYYWDYCLRCAKRVPFGVRLAVLRCRLIICLNCYIPFPFLFFS